MRDKVVKPRYSPSTRTSPLETPPVKTQVVIAFISFLLFVFKFHFSTIYSFFCSNIAMKVAMILPHLLLPKTKSETKGSNSKTLSRRIILWKQGLLDELFTEAKALQIRHPKQKKCEVNEEIKQFGTLMSTGKISAAIGCLSDKKTKGVIPLKEVIEGKTILSILKEKHPQAKAVNYVTEVNEDTMPYHPYIFEQINAKTLRKSTLKTHGSHGPSGLDAYE